MLHFLNNLIFIINYIAEYSIIIILGTKENLSLKATRHKETIVNLQISFSPKPKL